MISVSGLLDLSRMDQSLDVIIQGARPGMYLTAKLAIQDDSRVTWGSHARFKVSDQGLVRLAEASPLSGTYRQAHPMGLFWSMRPAEGEGLIFQKRNLAPLEYRFEIEDEHGALLLERQIVRNLMDPDVVVERLETSESHGLAGEFCYKKDRALKGRPLVLVFGGSGGGMDFSRRAASLLASHGYPALALAYFAYPGRPALLENIELEYFHNAIRWLRERAGDEQAPVTVVGGSRGGELSLALASHFPREIQQVVARVPSHVVWSQGEPSWTYQGEPLCHVPMMALQEVRHEYENLRKSGEYIALTPLFKKVLSKMDDLCREAAIPVERFDGQMLLISGEDDQTWPSSWFADRVVERMVAHGKANQVCHLKYPDAGHSIPIPYFPSTAHDAIHAVEKSKFKSGGTDWGDAIAAEDSWNHILDFVKKSEGL